MTEAERERRTTLVQRAIVAALGSGSIALLGWLAFFSTGAAFLTGGESPWIGPPSRTTTDAIFVDRRAPDPFVFRRRFEVSEVGADATIHVRALRAFRVRVNGREVARRSADEGWRRVASIPIAASLRSGRNQLEVEVRNATGPPLLQLWSEGLGSTLSTDDPWEVEQEGRRATAVRADDTALLAESVLQPAAAEVAASRLGWGIALFALGVLATVGLERLARERPALAAHAPQVALAGVTAYWLVVFFVELRHMPVATGFDVPAHLLYIDFILERGELPLASDGWSSYHPPLYYLATAALVGLFDVARDEPGGQIVYRLVPFAAGLANVWLAHGLARQLLPGAPLRRAVAVVFAGLLPMNLYMAAYPNNEPLHAALVGGVVLLTCRTMAQERPRPRDLVALTVCLGLALLTKYTAWIAVAVVVPALVARRIAAEGARAVPAAIATGATVLAGALAIAGPFYARNWIHFGRPLVLNTEALGDVGWWMQPGFHTPDYYLQFGEVLRHPFFAGFASFWDGLYSTFWGDGLLAGMVRLSTRHPHWDYDFMTLGYLLALPATALLVVGFVRCAREATQAGDAGRRAGLAFVLALQCVFLLALLAITMRYPYYAQVKAFYLLACTAPLAVVAGVGLAGPLEWLARPGAAALRWTYGGWLALFAGTLGRSFLG